MEARRYLAKVKQLQFGHLETVTHTLGRFDSLESAQNYARGQFGPPRYEILEVRQETGLQLLMHDAQRVAIRTFRVCIGIAIAWAIYAWSTSGGGLGDRAIGSLTINELLWAAIKGTLMLGGALAALAIAFGEGPPE